MLRKIFGALLVAVISLQASQAHADLAVWRGGAKVEQTSSGCNNGFSFFVAGEEASLLFLPAGLGDNSADSVLSVNSNGFMVSFKVVGGAISTGATTETNALDPFGNPSQTTGTFIVGKILPASFTETTKILTAIVRISNAGGPGCTVTMRAKLLKFNVN